MKLVQTNTLSQEVSDLEAGQQVSPTSRIYNLCPVLVDGLICFDTRFKRSPDLSGTAKFPPILGRTHPYTKLLIQHVHAMMGHRAHHAVLAELRQKC